MLNEAFTSASLPWLREQVAACAGAAGLRRDRVQEVVLAVHELIANAVMHGTGTGRLLIQTAGRGLHCQVTSEGKCGRSWPVRQPHGLWIVHQVADEFTVSPCQAGYRVTAVFHPR